MMQSLPPQGGSWPGPPMPPMMPQQQYGMQPSSPYGGFPPAPGGMVQQPQYTGGGYPNAPANPGFLPQRSNNGGSQFAANGPAPRPGNAEAQPARPIVRAKAPDDPTPRRWAEQAEAVLEMPTPEQLGIGKQRRIETCEIDWNDLHRRLEQMGIVSSQRQKLDQGGYRFEVILRTSQSNRLCHVETEAPTEFEAVRKTLEKVAELTK